MTTNLWPNVVSLTAVTVGLTWATVVAWIFSRQERDALPSATPDAPAREAAATELWKTYPAFPDDEPDTALFLLEESRRDYDGWVDSNARIEAKATWLTGFIAGGAGLLTIFGSAQGDKAQLQPGPFLYLAIVAAVASLLSCLYIVRPKVRSHPSVSAYISPPTAFVSKARFHLALSLAEQYNRSSVELAQSRRFDPVAWTTAQGCVILTIFALLVHFALHLSARGPDRTVVHCIAQAGPLRGGTAFKLSCEEP
jgi:hypothetical protein